MEDLNKTQLILLALLVSFVTSIATGIITVSLLQEAPQNVTQTINRVVEKTIERVVPEEGGSETVKEVTVVVKEEDLVIDSINVNSKSILRIKDNALVDGASQFYAVGFLASTKGLVVSALRDGLNSGSTFTGTFPDGKSFSMKVEKVSTAEGLVFFRILVDERNPLSAKAVKIGSSDPQLGQTVIAIEGEDKDIVSVGRVTSFIFSQGESGESKVPSRINTDIPAKTQIVGGPLINLAGEIVGVRISAAEGANESFLSLSLLKKALSGLE